MRLFAAALIAIVALLTLIVRSREARDDVVRRNVEVVDALWGQVDRSYVDRSFNGLDWKGVKENFRSKAMKSADRNQLYWDVLRPMTALLESSHTTVSLGPPDRDGTKQPDRSILRRKHLEVLEPALGRCFGLWIISYRAAISPKLVRVSPSSEAFKHGLRAGWRVQRVVRSPQPVLTLLDRAGREHEFGSGEAAGLGLEGLLSSKGIDLLFPSRQEQTAPSIVDFGRSDVSVSSGRFASGPEIALIDPRSEADSWGLSVGDKVVSLSAKYVSENAITSTGRFRRIDGTERAFKTTVTCPRLRAAPTPRSVSMSGGGYLIRLDDFHQGTFERLSRSEILTSKRVILDLRHNVGGSSAELSRVLGLFLKDGTALGRLSGGSRATSLRVRSGFPSYYKGPLAVLISGVSASAAEVAADALKRRPKTWVIGRLTAGEVQLSNTYALPDGGIASIAIEEFRTEDGARLERVGVAPTIDTGGISTLKGQLSDARFESEVETVLGMRSRQWIK